MRYICYGIIIIITTIISGCTPVSDMRSAVVPDYPGLPNNVLILADFGGQFGSLPNTIAKGFNSLPGDDLVTSLGTCGIQSEFLLVNDLLTREAATAKIQEVSPAAIIYIQWLKKTISSAGFQADYLVNIRDQIRGVNVWQSEFTYGNSIAATPSSFSNTILDQMKKDHVVPNNCQDDSNLIK